MTKTGSKKKARSAKRGARRTAVSLAKVARVAATSDPFAFVIMSFSNNPIIETYYAEAVQPAVKKVGLKCERIDRKDFSFTQRITDTMLGDIRNASVIIADLTEDRPNCYVEVGFALALERKIIFQKLKAPNYDPAIPFDLKDYRFILYTTAKDLRERLVKSLRAML